MLKKLSKQLNGEDWMWNNLNTLYWSWFYYRFYEEETGLRDMIEMFKILLKAIKKIEEVHVSREAKLWENRFVSFSSTFLVRESRDNN